MPDTNIVIFIQLRLLNPQQQPLGGTVSVQVTSPSGQVISLKGDASKDIPIGNMSPVAGMYQVVLTFADGTPTLQQSVGIMPGTANILEIIVNKGSTSATNTLQGNLVFDTGLPATGVTIRLYNIGFAGKDTQLGQVTSDNQGKYLFSYSLGGLTAPAPQAVNLQVRALDPAAKEVTISATKFNAGSTETLNLVVPSSVQSLASEFERLSADMQKSIGGVTQLGQAQEGPGRQDLTYVNHITGWDARLAALGATAAQQATTTGLGQDVLYALYRVGLPTDPTLLAQAPSATIQQALTKAAASGIVSMNSDQVTAAVNAFQGFASKTLLGTTASGAVSNFGSLLSRTFANNPQQQAAFANLYFNQPSAGSDLWAQAAKLGIPAQAINTLQLQGKFLYLTFNNDLLAAKLQQDIGTIDNLHQLADKDYHQPATWQNAVTALAGTGDQALAALIPTKYSGSTTADRLAAYAGDMARKVRLSFPTQVTARMIETHDLAVDPNTAANVTSFLRSASSLGYSLGRTPLNAFITNQANNLPALDDASKQSLKTLHRLYQITPSTESLQTALKLGFTSAHDIAWYSKTDFLAKYEFAFPPGEAKLIYRQAQTLSSITFNVFSAAKALDTQAPLYALSSDSGARQAAKDSLVQQFPSMASLFGNQDFCQCDDCRSVLSPAAYFVDLLDLLGQNSAPNAAGNTPLDVLIGKVDGIAGRRPDLGALPLTCANTNTAMPYIDLVNEIFEYYIAHNDALDAGAAYDTGSATTADLTAEPQHIIPRVYSTTLKQAVYPLNLPFDLWIETVRGFLNYFNIPLAQVLDALRPADNLELFTSNPATPYYQAQILAEALGISPAEYAVFTATDSTKWFNLYGNYANEAAALGDLKNAKTLSQKLGLSYQELMDLAETGFFNPGLYPLILQFERFGIDMGTAFSFTNQPGYPKWTDLSTKYPAQATAFQALLTSITAQYEQQNANSTFNATNWLNTLLPANYSQKVLVLADPIAGCDFSGTTLQYADGSAATPLNFLQLNLFVRLWKKLGWTLDETDRTLQTFFPANLPAFTDAGFTQAFGAAWKTALVYTAHLDDLNTRLAPALGRIALLPLWSDLPTQGENPLYAQLFLTPSVLNNDFAFDDPNGGFPDLATDLAPDQRPLSAHAAAVQGVLSLKAAEIDAIFADAGVAAPAAFSLANLSLCYRYSLLAQCLQIPVSDLITLRVMSGLNPFQKITGSALAVLADDILLKQTLAFVKQVTVVQNSGFTVEDLKYLLRHQFDPVGKYQSDQNALITEVQAIAGGLGQIQAQNSVPSDLGSLTETLIDQSLSGLFPAVILKALFAQITNTQIYTASVTSATALSAADFAQASDVILSYEGNTQTLSFTGLLPDWRKTELQQLNSNAALNAILTTLLTDVQQQAQAALNKSIADVLGVWASLVEYEAVVQGVAEIPNTAPLMQLDASLSLSYSQSGQLQWLGYRGVLTDIKMSALTAINNSVTLVGLLKNVQQQALPAYNDLIGSLLAMWCNVQTYKATQSGVTAANQIDPVAFSAALALAQQNGTITDPVPDIQITYSSAQIQTLMCQGILTDAMRAKLAALISSSTVLAGLLQTVRNQAVTEFQFLSSGLLAPAANDPDLFVGPFVGLDSAHQQRLAKIELVKVFLPLQARKLSRQIILQTVSANLGADATLTEALVTDAALLNDPSNPGESLLQSFLALGQQGVSASYYASSNQSGNPQAMGMADTTNTSDPTNHFASTQSCHFEGYLQAATDGSYRFLAELGNNGAQVTFRIDTPDTNALFANPIIQATASKDGDEASQFVQLKGSVAYHFSLDFLSLGANGASLLIQGENFPKGPLSQLVLYPQQSVDAFSRANVLLSKVIQVLQVTGLDVREISYLAEHAADFNNLALSALPTQASDDSVSKAAALFSQLLTLADYADLRKGPAGGTDGLIDVFQAASQSAPPTSTVLASLTRRDPQVVQDVATVLGPDPHFLNNIGIRRMWDALQLVQILGLPVSILSGATAIIAANPPAPDVIAANFKNAVKAQYSVDQWRPIATSVFNPLRQKKRDALVAYLMNALDVQSPNQLFEYFLVDPGMEPIVQTSRLRLALSSVQTFIQRCFLNLENGNNDPARNVAPSAIPADWWPWMKRYRVWQANREIFLFPENWMEPELRLDKTDLFQALESALLQGNVTSDLVEDAFLDYLKGLDLRARLDIIASYLDQDMVDPSNSTLYVLGRTYGHPHKYFYRTYANTTWSGWQAVTLDIESDHIVLAIWRGRLNVFWLTFIAKAQAPTAPETGPVPGNTPVTGLSISDLQSSVIGLKPLKQVQIQLHWSEYVQGKWTNRISTDVAKSDPINVGDDFDPSQLHVHVSKEMASSGNEGAVRIHVDVPNPYAWIFFPPGGGHGPAVPPSYAFRVTSKNCDPDLSTFYSEPPPLMPYFVPGIAPGIDATFYTGASNLEASFRTDIQSNGFGTVETETILNTVQNFELLTCGNAVAPAFLPPQGDPAYQEAGGLVSPFFFKDSSNPDVDNQSGFLDERTFFVQPSLTETVIQEWERWAIAPSTLKQIADPTSLNQINVVAQVPEAGPAPIQAADPIYSVFPMHDLTDWFTDPAVAVSYEGALIGKSGGIQVSGVEEKAGLIGSINSIATGTVVLVGKQGASVKQIQTARGGPANRRSF